MTCRYSRKRAFADQAHAVAGAERIRITVGDEYDQLYPYPCPDGPHWHLSHYEQGTQRCGTCNRLVSAWKKRPDWWVIGTHLNNGQPCVGEGTKAISLVTNHG